MSERTINNYTLMFACSVIMALSSACGSAKEISKQHIYFQNGMDTVLSQVKETIIQTNDLVSIQIFSKTLNQEQAVVFNIPATAGNNSQGYLVNSAGNIELPVIGPVRAAGLTTQQLQSEIEQKITSYVKDPSVIVRFLQFNVNVLGEVRSPGTQKFQVDRVTLIDAIGAAGDLTDFGKRDDVTVVREQGGKKIYYRVDLRNKDLFESPVYLLQPNDIVYVSPTDTKLKNLNVNPQAQRTTALFFTIGSFILSIGTLLITIYD